MQRAGGLYFSGGVIVKIKGRARLLGDHVSGDHIISSTYLSGGYSMEELLPHAFEACRSDLGPSLKPGDIIVAGENFGCGSSREHGILLMKTAGISCVIAKSFARSAYRACINLGLLPIEGCCKTRELQEIKIDTEQGYVKAGEEMITITAYPQKIMDIIREGGLLDYYRNHGGLE